MGPLSGFRIVDLTQMVAGPLATMILADQGADVIKVEPRAGDFTRTQGAGPRGLAALFASTNRNKRSIAVDLKDPRGVELVRRLVARADVFVQNFRPGAIDKLGLGETALREIRSELVYVSLSGFGERGPYVAKRVYDPVIQALSGLASIQADYQTGRPHMMRLIVPDKVTALTAAQAITAALLARSRNGRGQHVHLAMLDATIAFLWPEGMALQTFPDLGVKPPTPGPDLVFRTADGYLTAGAMSDVEWAGFCRALGHTEWLEDPRFRTPSLRLRNIALARRGARRSASPRQRHRRRVDAPRGRPAATGSAGRAVRRDAGFDSTPRPRARRARPRNRARGRVFRGGDRLAPLRRRPRRGTLNGDVGLRSSDEP
jgi:crotonobetainyl-CoA:carnitine CoA-transferase CaiB-like acyl-CoA transferase